MIFTFVSIAAFLAFLGDVCLSPQKDLSINSSLDERVDGDNVIYYQIPLGIVAD